MDVGMDFGGDYGGDFGGDYGSDYGGNFGDDWGGDSTGDFGGDYGADYGGDYYDDAGLDYGDDSGSDYAPENFPADWDTNADDYEASNNPGPGDTVYEDFTNDNQDFNESLAPTELETDSDLVDTPSVSDNIIEDYNEEFFSPDSELHLSGVEIDAAPEETSIPDSTMQETEEANTAIDSFEDDFEQPTDLSINNDGVVDEFAPPEIVAETGSAFDETLVSDVEVGDETFLSGQETGFDSDFESPNESTFELESEELTSESEIPIASTFESEINQAQEDADIVEVGLPEEEIESSEPVGLETEEKLVASDDTVGEIGSVLQESIVPDTEVIEGSETLFDSELDGHAQLVYEEEQSNQAKQPGSVTALEEQLEYLDASAYLPSEDQMAVTEEQQILGEESIESNQAVDDGDLEQLVEPEGIEINPNDELAIVQVQSQQPDLQTEALGDVDSEVTPSTNTLVETELPEEETDEGSAIQDDDNSNDVPEDLVDSCYLPSKVDEKLGKDTIWDADPFERGRDYEDLKEVNIGGNFETIDDYQPDSGTVTSLKTIDLNAQSYTDGEDDHSGSSHLRGTLNEYIEKLDTFDGASQTINGEMIEITEDDIQEKILSVGIPQGSINNNNALVLAECKAFAAEKNIKLLIEEVP